MEEVGSNLDCGHPVWLLAGTLGVTLSFPYQIATATVSFASGTV